jgi:hypothetical protein
MTDRQKVYTEVMRTLKDLLRGQKQGHVVTLAMMITGIVMSKKAQLSVMSSEVPHLAKTESVEKRMHRFVKNQQVDAQVCITCPLLRHWLPPCAVNHWFWRWMVVKWVEAA